MTFVTQPKLTENINLKVKVREKSVRGFTATFGRNFSSL